MFSVWLHEMSTLSSCSTNHDVYVYFLRLYGHALGPSRRPPLELSLDFILSGEGAFVRSALVSDLKVATASSVLKRVPRVFRRRWRRGPRGSAATSAGPASPPPAKREQRPQQQPLACDPEDDQDHGDSEANRQQRSDVEDPGAAATGTEARAASRRLLRRRALRGARRRPVLVIRVAGAVLAAAGRGMGTVRGRLLLQTG